MAAESSGSSQHWKESAVPTHLPKKHEELWGKMQTVTCEANSLANKCIEEHKVVPGDLWPLFSLLPRQLSAQYAVPLASSGLASTKALHPITASGVQKCGILEGHALHILLHRHSLHAPSQEADGSRISKGVVPLHYTANTPEFRQREICHLPEKQKFPTKSSPHEAPPHPPLYPLDSHAQQHTHTHTHKHSRNGDCLKGNVANETWPPASNLG